MTHHSEKDSCQADQALIPLNRNIGLSTGILLVAGTLIGSGIFKKIAPMSALLMNKDYILLAWLLAGIISMFGAFTMAGMAGLTRESGGIYEYLRLSFGNLFSFLYGWASFLVIGCGGNAAIAYIFAQSVNSIIPLPNPMDLWKDISIGHFIYPFAGSGVKLLAIISIVLLSWINILSAKKGSRLNDFITACKIIGILALILMGVFYNGSPQTATVAEVHVGSVNLFSAIIAAMVSAFWAYDGWYCIGFMSGEIKNPEKNVPRSIISGISMVIIIYLLINYAFMQVMTLPALATLDENAIAGVEVARVIMGNGGVLFLAILIALSTFGSLNSTIITYPRMYYRMAQEKFFPQKFSYVHPRYKTPYYAIIYCAIWTCIMIISGTFDILTNTIIIVEFLFFILLGLGLIKMKRAGKITGKLIAYPLSPIILILFSIGLIIITFIQMPVESVAGIGFTILGIPVYYYYDKKNRIKKDLIPE
ncbi:MAG: amino acid permease [Bacteroidetes bacterium]|nr:amino acid permease [Bacteroidota bacterium]